MIIIKSCKEYYARNLLKTIFYTCMYLNWKLHGKSVQWDEFQTIISNDLQFIKEKKKILRLLTSRILNFKLLTKWNYTNCVTPKPTQKNNPQITRRAREFTRNLVCYHLAEVKRTSSRVFNLRYLSSSEDRSQSAQLATRVIQKWIILIFPWIFLFFKGFGIL